jgi:hypothetical protein
MRAWIMPPHPQYRVRWKQNKTCEACDFKSTEQYTFAFFEPEAALELATYVLKQGHALIFVEQ